MKKKISVAAVSITFGVTVLSGTSAHSVAVLAGPGAFITGYTTSNAVADPAAPLEFVNLDLQEHSVVSTTFGPNSNPWCAKYFYAAGKCPLFRSDDIASGSYGAVGGVAALQKGASYNFYCAQHPGTMKGTLSVQ